MMALTRPDLTALTLARIRDNVADLSGPGARGRQSGLRVRSPTLRTPSTPNFNAAAAKADRNAEAALVVVSGPMAMAGLP
jgi:hypothetical protein